jgi:hypothetical protein
VNEGEGAFLHLLPVAQHDQKMGLPESSLMSFFQTLSICATTLSGIGM